MDTTTIAAALSAANLPLSTDQIAVLAGMPAPAVAVAEVQPAAAEQAPAQADPVPDAAALALPVPEPEPEHPAMSAIARLRAAIVARTTAELDNLHSLVDAVEAHVSAFLHKP